MKSFYISTPIYYVNGRPHFGHAYTSVLADMLTRFHALEGENVFFLTGTDEHGDKIQRSAEKEGISPQALADRYSADFKQLWEQMDVKYSHFIRTTDESHKHVVQDILQRIYDNGDIYFGEYGGHYCYGCERFYVENELEDGLCPQHKTKPEYIQEKNYFFKMKKYLPWLKTYITEHPDCIQPSNYRKEVLALLDSGGLEDLCISRPKTRLSWGIELPFDTDYVCYVWFDALLNYISGLGYPNDALFQSFWSEAEHIIAKDILKPHAIFWPCILQAAGLPIFKTLYVHGYWLVRDTKLSKSLGNAVDPITLIKQFGVDAIRYFLLRDMSFGSDASFSLPLMVQRITAELANDIGNLFSRSLAMLAKYCDSIIPQPHDYTQDDELLQATINTHMMLYKRYCREVAPAKALENVVAIASSINKYIDAQAPWSLHKNNNLERLHTVLYCVLEGMRKLTVALLPIIPSTAKTMLALLGIASPIGISLQSEEAEWGLLTAGNRISERANLFPRDAWSAVLEASTVEDKKKEATLQEITFEHFSQVDIRVGSIIEAVAVKDTDTLLMLQVDVGEGQPRCILSGIAEQYRPDELIGKLVLVLVNLAPKKIRGIESQGMLLTIKDGRNIILLEPARVCQVGSRVI